MLLDKVKIIDQPFSCRGDRLIGRNRLAQLHIGVGKRCRIVAQAPDDRVDRDRTGSDGLRSCEALPVFTKAVDAEEFGPDRLIVVPLLS